MRTLDKNSRARYIKTVKIRDVICSPFDTPKGLGRGYFFPEVNYAAF